MLVPAVDGGVRCLALLADELGEEQVMQVCYLSDPNMPAIPITAGDVGMLHNMYACMHACQAPGIHPLQLHIMKLAARPAVLY